MYEKSKNMRRKNGCTLLKSYTMKETLQHYLKVEPEGQEGE